MRFFNRKPKRQSLYDLLDTPLYKIPETKDVITWGDSVEGSLITGQTGSGKSSAIGKHIAHAMLKAGFGMCIFCIKKDEAQRWVDYVEDAAPHRIDDIVLFNKNSGFSFNFLAYELNRGGEGGGDILNAVEALMNLNAQNQVYMSGGGSGREERFWDLSLRRLISRTIVTLQLAGEEVSIPNMRKLVATCFKGDDSQIYHELEREAGDTSIDAQKRDDAERKIQKLINSNYFLQVLMDISNKDGIPEAELELIMNYWLQEFPKIGERATSIVVESFMGIVEPFLNRGILKNQFSHGLDEELLPENIYRKNSIVIIDYPVKEFGIAGIYAATIYKTTFQAAMERREVELEDNPKPVGFWIDEYQQLCSHKTDSQFQATARSSWVATVYISQNITSLYYVMGNDQPQAKAKSLLGNLNLKFFAANDNFDTNTWASDMIGKHLVDFETLNISKDKEISKSKIQHLLHKIMPDHFTTFRTGGKRNNYIVDTVVFKAGRTWGRDKRNYALVGFRQR